LVSERYGEHAVLMRTALRRLAEEARHRLASLEPEGREHDFYVGVMMAAEDLARRGSVRSVSQESPSFREGYLQVTDLVAAAAGHTPSRLPLPTPANS
jgi:hypothetical protein